MRGFRLSFQFLKLFLGTALAAWALCTPWIGLTLLMSIRTTFVVLFVLAVLAFFLVLGLSEWGALKLLGGQMPRSYGLRNSYESAHVAAGTVLKTRPALVTFPDPVPNVFVIRALGGDGAVLLSDGFISILDESELRFVLARAIQHLTSGEIILQSACVFALLMIQRAYSTHVDRLSPFAALKRLLLFPWLRFYSSLAIEATETTGRVGSQSEFRRGASKLARAEQLYGQEAFLPGLVYLGIER
jgi:Zn-dependent protease with chaperone function